MRRSLLAAAAAFFTVLGLLVAAPASTATTTTPKPAPTSTAIPTAPMPVPPGQRVALSPLGFCRDGKTLCANIINFGGSTRNAIGVDRYYYVGTPAYDRLLPPRWASTAALYGWQHTEGIYVWGGACLTHLDRYGQPFMTTVGPKYLFTAPARLDYRLISYNCSQTRKPAAAASSIAPVAPTLAVKPQAVQPYFWCTWVSLCGRVKNRSAIGIGIAPENYGGNYKWVLGSGHDSSEFTVDVGHFWTGPGYCTKVVDSENGKVTWAGQNTIYRLWDRVVTVEARRNQTTGTCVKW